MPPKKGKPGLGRKKSGSKKSGKKGSGKKKGSRSPGGRRGSKGSRSPGRRKKNLSLVADIGLTLEGATITAVASGSKADKMGHMVGDVLLKVDGIKINTKNKSDKQIEQIIEDLVSKSKGKYGSYKFGFDYAREKTQKYPSTAETGLYFEGRTVTKVVNGSAVDGDGCKVGFHILEVGGETIRWQGLDDSVIENQIEKAAAKCFAREKKEDRRVEYVFGQDMGICWQCNERIYKDCTTFAGNKMHLECFKCSHCSKRIQKDDKIVVSADGRHAMCMTCGQLLAEYVEVTTTKTQTMPTYTLEMAGFYLSGNRVTSVVPDSQAEKMGHEVGDRLLEVTGKVINMKGLENPEIEDLIQRMVTESIEENGGFNFEFSKKDKYELDKYPSMKTVGLTVVRNKVVHVVENSPADKDGAQVGDILLMVDGQCVETDGRNDGEIEEEIERLIKVSIDRKKACSFDLVKTKGECTVCQETITSEYMKYEGDLMHVECFTCIDCNEPVDVDEEFAKDQDTDRPICASCEPTTTRNKYEEKFTKKEYTTKTIIKDPEPLNIDDYVQYVGLEIDGNKITDVVRGGTVEQLDAKVGYLIVKVSDEIIETKGRSNNEIERDIRQKIKISIEEREEVTFNFFPDVGKCHVCDENIYSRYTEYRDNLMHVECFKCYNCDEQIKGKNSIVEDPETGDEVCISCAMKNKEKYQTKVEGEDTKRTGKYPSMQMVGLYLEGVLVKRVISGSPAERTGAKVGYALLKVGSQTIESENRDNDEIEEEIERAIQEMVDELGRVNFSFGPYKGECPVCDKSIHTAYIERDGKVMHVECFKCDDCGVNITRDMEFIISKETGKEICLVCASKRQASEEPDEREPYTKMVGFKLNGNVIRKVTRGSPAERAGAKVGDCLTGVGGETIDSNDSTSSIEDVIESTIARLVKGGGSLTFTFGETKGDCFVCNEGIFSKYMVHEGRKVHAKCFKCSECGGDMDDSGDDDSWAINHNGKAVCLECAKSMERTFSLRGKYFPKDLDLSSIRGIFDDCDGDDDGELQKREVPKFCRQYVAAKGIDDDERSQVEKDFVFNFDLNRDGKILWTEIELAYESAQWNPDTYTTRTIELPKDPDETDLTGDYPISRLIGITLEGRRILTVKDGSPADKMGAAPGLIVMKVDGQDLEIGDDEDDDQIQERIEAMCREAITEKHSCSFNFGNDYGECVVCGKNIYQRYTTVDGERMHPDCFTCKDCDEPIAANVNYYKCQDTGGQVCENCKGSTERKLDFSFRSEETTIGKDWGDCYACKKAIYMKKLTFEGHTYHPRCFQCCECSQVIPTGENFMRTEDDEIICDSCAQTTDKQLRD